jgi:hypothetical protein
MILRQFAEPSLETGGVLDGALSVDHRRLCWRVSVMVVLKIGDEKRARTYGTTEVYWFELNLRTGLARVHVIGHSLVSNLGGLRVIGALELKTPISVIGMLCQLL